MKRRGEASWWKEYLGQGHLPALALGSEPHLANAISYLLAPSGDGLGWQREKQVERHGEQMEGRLRVTQAKVRKGHAKAGEIGGARVQGQEASRR